MNFEGEFLDSLLDRRRAAAEDQRDDEEHEEDKEQDLGDVREVALKPDEAEQSGDQGENGKNKSPSEHDLVSLRGCGTSLRNDNKLTAWEHSRQARQEPRPSRELIPFAVLSGCPGEIIGFGG